MSTLTLTLREVLPATPRARIARIDLGDNPFDYAAGQAVMIASHGAEKRRPYSIASAPEEARRDGFVELLIGVNEDGVPGAHLALDPGALVDVEGPLGAFTFPPAPEETRFIFIAGGTGIAPLRSMIREYLHRSPEPRPALVYSARTPEEFAYGDELRAMADAGRLDLTLTLTGDAQDWRHARGRTGDRHLAALATPKTVCFICGPPSMVTDVPEALTRLGIPRNQIVTEDW